MPDNKVEAQITLDHKQVDVSVAAIAASMAKLDASVLTTDRSLKAGLQATLAGFGNSVKNVNFDRLSVALRELKVDPANADSMKDFAAALKDVTDIVKSNADSVKNLTAGFAGTAAVFGGAAAGAALVAGQFEQLESRLVTATGNSATAFERFQQAKDLAAQSPFDLKGVVQAAGQIEAFKLSSQELLPVAAKLAAGMGAELPGATLAFSKAAAGSAEGFNSLRDLYGITTKELLKFGAAEGKIKGTLDHSDENIERNREALVKLINTRFGDALERQSQTLQGAMSNVKDSAEVAVAGFGKALIPIGTLGARAVAGLLGAVDAIPGPLKAIGAGAAVAVSGIAGIGAIAGGSLAGLLLLQGRLASIVAGMAELGVTSPLATSALTRVTATLGGVQTAMSKTSLAAVGLRLGFLGLAAVVAVVGTAIISAWEETEKRVGDAVTGTANKVADSNQFFRKGVDALNKAGQGAGTTVQIIGDAGKQMDQLNNAFLRLPAAEVVRAFLAMGITSETLTEKLKKAEAGAKEFREKLMLLQEARAAYTRPGGVEADEFLAFQQKAKDAGISQSIATLEELDDAIGKVTFEYQSLGKTQLLAQKGLKDFDTVLKPLVEATQKSAQLGQFLDLSKQVGTAQALAGALESVNKQIGVNSGVPAIGSADQTALVGKLGDPTINDLGRAPEKAGIEAQLALVRQRDEITKAISENAERAARQEAETAELAFRRKKALGEANLHSELTFIKERLAAVKTGSEEEVRLLERRAEVQARIKQKEAEALKRDFEKQFSKVQQNQGTTESQKISELKRLEAAYKGSAEIQKTLASAVYAHEKRLNDQRIKDAQDLAGLKAQLAQDETARSQARQGDLQRLSRRGVDTRDAEESEIKKQADQRKKEIDEQLQKDLSAKGLSPQYRKGLAARAKEQKADVDNETQRQVRDLNERTNQDNGSREGNLLQRQQRVSDFTIELLKGQAAQGKNVEADLKSAIQERLALQLKEIRLQEQLHEAQTDDPREAALAEREAQAAILQARQAANEELKNGLALMKQAKDAAKDSDPGEFSGRKLTVDQFVENENKRFEFKKPGQLGPGPNLVPGVDLKSSEASFLNGAKGPRPADASAVTVVPVAGKFVVEVTIPAIGQKVPGTIKEVTLDGHGSKLERNSRAMSGRYGIP